MRVLAVILLLFLGCTEAMACSGCEYQRMAIWYPPVVCIRLVVVPFLVAGRLDFIRVLGVFVVYEVVWYYAYGYTIWFMDGDGVLSVGAILSYLILEAGALGAGLLYLLGRMRFFRRKPDIGLVWWHACLYVPVAIVIRKFV